MAQNDAEGPDAWDYFRLIDELRSFRDGLVDRPSDRELARNAGVSQTTIGSWMKGARFPQANQILKVIEAVQQRARRQGRLDGDAVFLLDRDRWIRALTAERERRRDTTRSIALAGQADWALATGPGVLLSERRFDMLDLGVQAAIDIGPDAGNLNPLPPYISRSHDRRLAERVIENGVEQDRSAAAIVVGDSATGKTRACAELIHNLGDPWRIWRPERADRATALLEDLDRIAPHTVLWLDDAQHFLYGAAGELIAAGLSRLLRDPARAPVLVLGTLWPGHHAQLAADPPDGVALDPHLEARTFLAGNIVSVGRFSEEQLEALRTDVDPRLARAAAEAVDGALTQYLAGVPAVIEQYRLGPPIARALIDTAIDLARLASLSAPARGLVQEAAIGYLTDVEWDRLAGVQWDIAVADALAYTGTPCRGVRGALVVARPRGQRCEPALDTVRVADPIEQIGRAERAEAVPPDTFWSAACRWLNGEQLDNLAQSARMRGLSRWSAVLRRHAVVDVDRPAGVWRLIHSVVAVDPGRLNDMAAWLVEHVAAIPAFDMKWLYQDLRDSPGGQGRARDVVAALLDRVRLDDLERTVELLNVLHSDGHDDLVSELRGRGIVASSDLVDPLLAARLIDQHLAWLSLAPEIRQLAERAVGFVTPTDIDYFVEALRGHDVELARVALTRARGHVDDRDPLAVARVLDAAAAVDRADQVLAEHTPLRCTCSTDQHGLIRLAKALNTLGAAEPLEDLLQGIANQAETHGAGWLESLYDMAHELQLPPELEARLPVITAAIVNATPTSAAGSLGAERGGPDCSEELMGALVRFVDRLEANGSDEELDSLMGVWTGGLNLDEPPAPIVHVLASRPLTGRARIVAWRLLARWRGSPQDATSSEKLVKELPGIVLDDPEAVHGMLEILTVAEWNAARTALLARNPAASVSLAEPNSGVLDLLKTFHRLGETDQIHTLAQRAAAELPLLEADDGRPHRTGQALAVVDWLSDAGHPQEAADLAARVARVFVPASPSTFAWVLSTFVDRGLNAACDVLLGRDLASSVPLGGSTNPFRKAPLRLLPLLAKIGAVEQVSTLSRRLAEDFDLSAAGSTADLVKVMRTLGQDAAARRLVRRARDSGHFWLAQNLDADLAARFPHGREPGNMPSLAWGWSDVIRAG